MNPSSPIPLVDRASVSDFDLDLHEVRGWHVLQGGGATLENQSRLNDVVFYRQTDVVKPCLEQDLRISGIGKLGTGRQRAWVVVRCVGAPTKGSPHGSVAERRVAADELDQFLAAAVTPLDEKATFGLGNRLPVAGLDENPRRGPSSRAFDHGLATLTLECQSIGVSRDGLLPTLPNSTAACSRLAAGQRRQQENTDGGSFGDQPITRYNKVNNMHSKFLVKLAVAATLAGTSFGCSSVQRIFYRPQAVVAKAPAQKSATFQLVSYRVAQAEPTPANSMPDQVATTQPATSQPSALPYTAPGLAFRLPASAAAMSAVGLTGERETFGAGKEAAEGSAFSPTDLGLAGRTGVTAQSPIVGNTVVSRDGLVDGPIQSLGRANTASNILTAQVNPASGSNGACQRLFDAGFATACTHNHAVWSRH